MGQLQACVQALHASRRNYESAAAALAEKRAAFERENAELIAHVKELGKLNESIYEELTAAAVEAVSVDELRDESKVGVGWVCPGVQVKLVREVDASESAAVGWAVLHNLPHLLKVNRVDFNKVARATIPLGGEHVPGCGEVRIVETKKAYVDTNLTRAVEAMAGAAAS